ncbi:hypothetical protein SAMN05216464_11274 [Mucilaginibacter pineti]|uniref:Uncharacterized protein n=1 Tax=Mucilaginibacter pineti TaxID=1391627 RepID=A0A1G7HY32_9SPHI|nr:hypothetical protein SAMN05216464_11274 [Mucilaginibacter pineti]
MKFNYTIELEKSNFTVVILNVVKDLLYSLHIENALVANRFFAALRMTNRFLTPKSNIRNPKSF